MFRFIFFALIAIIVVWLIVALFFQLWRRMRLEKEVDYFSSFCSVCPARLFGCDMADSDKVSLTHIKQNPELNYKFNIKCIQKGSHNYYLIKVTLNGFSRYIDYEFNSIDECEKLISSLVNERIKFMERQVASNEENLQFKLAAEKFNKKLKILND